MCAPQSCTFTIARGSPVMSGHILPSIGMDSGLVTTVCAHLHLSLSARDQGVPFYSRASVNQETAHVHLLHPRPNFRMGPILSKAKRATSYLRQTRNIMPTIGSKTSTTEHPTSAKTRTVTIPRIPQEIVDEILDYLTTDCILNTLRACALVSKLWVPSCRRHLFHTALFTARNMHRWFRVFPVPEESPAHLVKELRVWIAGQDWVPERFFEYTSCFTNTERVHLLGYGGAPPLRVPSLWKLPQSVTSLVINSGVVTLTQIRDIMAQLPNLDDLSLMGSLIRMDNGAFVGIGTVLTGRFGGKLLLRGECADKSVLNMLSEVPTGLRFTEVDISCTGKCLLSTVQLVRACGRNLVKLSCTVCIYSRFHAFSMSKRNTATDTISRRRQLCQGF